MESFQWFLKTIFFWVIGKIVIFLEVVVYVRSCQYFVIFLIPRLNAVFECYYNRKY